MQEWKELDSGVATLADAPLFMHESVDLPMDELTETVHRCIKETGTRIVFIDCLQMIDFAKEDVKSSKRMAKVMYSLKHLAQQVDIPIVAGSMLSRGVEYWSGAGDGEPRLIDLANSSYIEEFADVVMMVHRPEYYRILTDEHGRDLQGLMQVIVNKNALKPLGDIVLKYYQETGRLSWNNETSMPEENRVRLEDFNTGNPAIQRLIKTFDLEDDIPF